MPNLKGIPRTAGIAIAVFVLVAATIGVRRYQSHKDIARAREADSARKTLVRTRVELWKTAAKAPIPSPELEKLLADSVKEAVGQRLTTEQERALLSTCRNLFDLCGNPSFTNYFKLKAVGKHSVQVQTNLSAFKKAQAQQSIESVKLEAVWKAMHSWTVTNSPDRVEAICYTNFSVKVIPLLSTNFNIYQECVDLLPHMIGQMNSSTFIYQNDIESLFQRGYTPVPVGVLRFVAKYNFLANPSPIVATFYWSEPDRAWIPWQLAVHSTHFRTMF